MFKNILVPTDGSALSKKGIKKAALLAAKLGARITGFHVAPAYHVNLYADYIPPDFMLPAEFKAKSEVVSKRYLEDVKKAAASEGVRYQGFFVSSNFAAEAIVKAAKTHKCDAIVMASHGRSGLSRMLLGSETSKVLSTSKVPVVVLR